MPLLMLPSEPLCAWSDGVWRGRHSDFWNHLPAYGQALALVKFNGVWTLESLVSEDFADFYLLGGYNHIISQELADELTAAGFGQYIFPDDTPPDDLLGFGEGGFGEGGFGA